MKEFRSLVEYPIEVIKVRVGLGGKHYHLVDCPAAEPDAFVHGSIGSRNDYDYMEIEIPKVLADKGYLIDFLGRQYVSHIPVCKELVKRSK